MTFKLPIELKYDLPPYVPPKSAPKRTGDKLDELAELLRSMFYGEMMELDGELCGLMPTVIVPPSGTFKGAFAELLDTWAKRRLDWHATNLKALEQALRDDLGT